MAREKPSVLVLHNAPAAAGLYPGASCAESDAGVLSQAKAVAAALARAGHVHRVVAVRTLAEVISAVAHAPEPVVFNLIESLGDAPGAELLVPALCAAHGKGCTGGDTPCAALTLDKWRTRAVLQGAGLPVPGGLLVRVGEKVPTRGLPRGPLIVKPVSADASEGIDTHSLCPGPGVTLRRLVAEIHAKFGQPALVEQFVDGRELNVGLWQRGSEVTVLPIAEIDFSGYGRELPHLVGYRAKWVPGTPEYHGLCRVLPARLPARLAAQVTRLARAAWDACGCSDYARVDFRLSRRGAPFILEVNVDPDISPDAGFSAALKAGGVRYATFVGALVANAAARRPAPADGAPPAVPARASRNAAAPRRATIRHSVPADRQPVLDLLAATGFFRPDELEVAAEVLDDALEAGSGGHYQSFVAEDEAGVAGWVCAGPTPCTLGAWDIYWLGVAPDRQGRGTGKALVRHCEALILARGGNLSVIETSGSSGYTSTRGFYLGCGYDEAACIADYYAIGDDRIIYTKRLRG